MPSVSVIIVSYKVRHYIEQCVDSVLRSLPDAQIIIVDNRSDDGSAEFLAARFPQATVIANSENLGFGKANNMALAHASGRYVLFLNPDTVVAGRTIPGCVEFMDSHPEAGAVGVRMQYGNGCFAPESRRSVPTPSVSFFHMSGLGRLFPGSRLFARYHLTYIDRDQPCGVEVVSGAYMFVRKEALDRTGGFDETFFMYGEDIDLSYRILKAGYENRYLPLPIVHYKGESTVKTSYRYAKVFYDAMQIFYDKHFRHYSGLFSLLVRVVLGIRKIATFIGQNLLAGKRRLADSAESCVFIGGRSCFEKASSLVAGSRFLKDMDYVGCNGIMEIPETELAGKEAVVFDTSAFTYNEILDWMYDRACQGKPMTMGLFNPDTGRLITEDEVL